MTDTQITHGTVNVFADLGLSDPAERQTKTRLAFALNRIIKDRALKQLDAARLLGVPQPKVSALVNYRLDGFSVEKLMDFIVALGRDVEIVVRVPRGDAPARVIVSEAA
ncbi:MAG: helix-turn-helix domain-containing protein [Sphingomonas sp.]|uniref:helix-turn-helix domain-containing protein n=1 Tax=Sphingomonas sp. TaxID=28214 RepID=UPI0025D950FB|nr:helix-turn-helix transcriptional regulator [Sphingomonas sp.]MBY0285408.1 helix-turn-helix domain-containing protein [Sphingomonas sp.]